MGPFYIAMVNPGTAYSAPTHHVEDEILEYMRIDHTEGNIPTLTIRFENPYMGPLNPARKTGIIVSWDSGAGIIPLFVGQLMAIPSDIVGETITYVYHSKAVRYEENLRLLADSMRHLPEYDEIFVSFDKRDDPDVVLEGYSKLWHVDRVTNDVTASDVLEGEDDTTDPELFTEADQPDHTTLSVEIDQNLLPHLTCVMNVNWTQSHVGYIDTGSRAFATFSGESVVSSWPKPRDDFGGGWSAAVSGAKDPSGGGTDDSSRMITYQASYTNNAKKHRNGDTMSVNLSDTVPAPGITASSAGSVISYQQTGLVDPFAVDSEGKPAPKMIPMEIRGNKTWLSGGPTGDGVNTALTVRYDAARERSETLSFQVEADLQPFPVSAGQGETITLNGADVGEPFVRLETWSDVAGEVVTVGQMIFPSYIGFPGSRIAMRATTGGTAGTVLPDFPETAGATVADGGVVWTSLGVVSPNSSSEQWDSEIDIEAGTILLPRVSDNVPTYAMLVQSGLLSKPQTGTDVDTGQIIKTAGGTYQVATVGGITERRGAPFGAFFSLDGPTFVPLNTTPVEPGFSGTWGVGTNDGTVVWTSLGTSLPNGMNQFIALDDGVTGTVMPAFPTVVGGTVVDGTLTWCNIGVAQIPMGGTPGNVPNASYFPTTRGQQSIQYGMCVTRAKLRYRSRMVKISTGIPFLRAATLSCRQSATIEERRLPGGEATGKIIAYFMEVDGPAAAMRAGITIGCSIGAGTEVVADEGDPVYAVAPGYALPGWQQYEDAVIVLQDTEDMAYTPPVARTIDDGLVFPLTNATAILRQQVVGSVQTQYQAALQSIATSNQTQSGSFPVGGPSLFNESISGQQTAAESAAKAIADAIAQMVADNPYYYEIHFPNVTNGPFNADYSLVVTPATLPRQIDLEAA